MPRKKTLSDEEVLQIAARVMLESGPSDFTLADIGLATGMAPATLLQRFGDKQSLVVAAIAQDNRQFTRMLAELPLTKGEAAVITVFSLITPDTADAASFGNGLLWLRQDMRDPQLNRLARERFFLLRRAVAARMPPLAVPAEQAARLVEAQWQGTLNQWGLEPEGRLLDFVVKSLKAWFALARRE
jgi:AcrR family transcriptional regulator